MKKSQSSILKTYFKEKEGRALMQFRINCALLSFKDYDLFSQTLNRAFFENYEL